MYASPYTQFVHGLHWCVLYTTVYCIYAEAHNEMSEMNFLPQRIAYTRTERSHSSFPFSQMQVFVTRCDDWLSDSCLYWWGNWFEDWLTARETLDGYVIWCGEQAVMGTHCSDIKWEKHGDGEERRVMWFSLRSEVIDTWMWDCCCCWRSKWFMFIFLLLIFFSLD